MMTVGVLAAFHVHCRLIVSTAGDFDTFHCSIYKSEVGENFHLDLNPEAEEAKELAKLCYEMEPYDKVTQKELQQSLESEDIAATHIWFIFHEKYGHEF